MLYEWLLPVNHDLLNFTVFYLSRTPRLLFSTQFLVPSINALIQQWLQLINLVIFKLASANGLVVLLAHLLNVEAFDRLRLLDRVYVFLRYLTLRNGDVVLESARLNPLCVRNGTGLVDVEVVRLGLVLVLVVVDGPVVLRGVPGEASVRRLVRLHYHY